MILLDLVLSLIVYEWFRLSCVPFIVKLTGKRWFHRNIYLYSLHWRLVRWVKLKTSVYKCQKCNRRDHLDLHHLTYDHYWNEYFHLSDLVWLCRKHHNEIHQKA